MELKERQDALLVAVVRGMDDYHLNGPMDRILGATVVWAKTVEPEVGFDPTTRSFAIVD